MMMLTGGLAPEQSDGGVGNDILRPLRTLAGNRSPVARKGPRSDTDTLEVCRRPRRRSPVRHRRAAGAASP